LVRYWFFLFQIVIFLLAVVAALNIPHVRHWALSSSVGREGLEGFFASCDFGVG